MAAIPTQETPIVILGPSGHAKAREAAYDLSPTATGNQPAATRSWEDAGQKALAQQGTLLPALDSRRGNRTKESQSLL